MATLKIKKDDGTWDYLSGIPGKKGDKGDKGDTGEAGISVTHSWDGTKLVITSASGTSSTDLKGDKGDSPVKGTDYWNEEDKAEIKSYVDQAILGGAW